MPGRKDLEKNIDEARKVHRSTERDIELIQGSHSNSNQRSIRFPRRLLYDNGKET